LRETNGTIDAPAAIPRLDLGEYLAHLADRQLVGVTRARKVATLREYFRWYCHVKF